MWQGFKLCLYQIGCSLLIWNVYMCVCERVCIYVGLTLVMNLDNFPILGIHILWTLRSCYAFWVIELRVPTFFSSFAWLRICFISHICPDLWIYIFTCEQGSKFRFCFFGMVAKMFYFSYLIRHKNYSLVIKDQNFISVCYFG